MSSYYNSAYGGAAGFGSAMHNTSLAAAAANLAATASPSAMQDAMKAYSGMEDKYRYSAITSMYPSAEAVAAAAAKYMQEAAGKSYLDSGNSRYFDSGSPNKHFTPGKYVLFLFIQANEIRVERNILHFMVKVAFHEECRGFIKLFKKFCILNIGKQL